jgi:hypothetical protein
LFAPAKSGEPKSISCAKNASAPLAGRHVAAAYRRRRRKMDCRPAARLAPGPPTIDSLFISLWPSLAAARQLGRVCHGFAHELWRRSGEPAGLAVLNKPARSEPGPADAARRPELISSFGSQLVGAAAVLLPTRRALCLGRQPPLESRLRGALANFRWPANWSRVCSDRAAARPPPPHDDKRRRNKNKHEEQA